MSEPNSNYVETDWVALYGSGQSIRRQTVFQRLDVDATQDNAYVLRGGYYFLVEQVPEFLGIENPKRRDAALKIAQSLSASTLKERLRTDQEFRDALAPMRLSDDPYSRACDLAGISDQQARSNRYKELQTQNFVGESADSFTAGLEKAAVRVAKDVNLARKSRS